MIAMNLPDMTCGLRGRARWAMPVLPALKRLAPWAERVQASSAAGWAAILATALAAMLANSLDPGLSHMRPVIAMMGACAVSTVCLAVGWTLEPDRTGRWCVRSLVASSLSAFPAVF